MTTYAWAPHAYTEFDGAVYLARLPSGPLLQLSDSASLVAACVETGDSLETVVERVALAVELPASALHDDVRAVLLELTQQGLLELRHE